jgi:hypothetical protein
VCRLRRIGVSAAAAGKKRAPENYAPSIMMIGHSHARAYLSKRSEDALLSAPPVDRLDNGRPALRSIEDDQWAYLSSVPRCPSGKTSSAAGDSGNTTGCAPHRRLGSLSRPPCRLSGSARSLWESRWKDGSRSQQVLHHSRSSKPSIWC